MEASDCDPERLYRTYRRFQVINTWLSRTHALYTRWLRPLMALEARPYTLLDIGFGGGDILRALHHWAGRDGYELAATGIEIDQRALDYVQHLQWPQGCAFRRESLEGLIAAGERYDFVISNHVLHHVPAAELRALLFQAQSLANLRVVFNDLARSDLAWLGFAALTLYGFSDTFIREDGLLSIKRAYTYRELRALAPPDWQLERLLPFRLVLHYTNGGHYSNGGHYTRGGEAHTSAPDT